MTYIIVRMGLVLITMVIVVYGIPLVHTRQSASNYATPLTADRHHPPTGPLRAITAGPTTQSTRNPKRTRAIATGVVAS